MTQNKHLRRSKTPSKPKQSESAGKRMKKIKEAAFVNLKKRTKEWDSFSYKLHNKNISFAELNLLEQKCRKILQAHKPAIEFSKSKAKRRQLEAEQSNFRTILASIWHRYIELYNKQFHQDVNLCDVSLYLHESTKLPMPIEASVHHFIATRFAPDHPKDEYRKARRTRRHFTIFAGETNTYKTFRALHKLERANSGVYLAPLRLLALQTFRHLNELGIPCSLLTGEEAHAVDFARHVSSTIEKLDIAKEVDVAVIDEAQMISDKFRGSAWTRAILGVVAKEVYVCCSLNAVKLVVQLIEDCEDSYDIVECRRNTELVVEDASFRFPSDVKHGDALIAFSKSAVLELFAELTNLGHRVSVIYGSLPPETRRSQMGLFNEGGSNIVVATDAIGMGLNLPIKRVVFMEAEKFDGDKTRPLNPAEIKQIAGRAGRKGKYDVGYVNSITKKNRIKEFLSTSLRDLDAAYYLPSKQHILSLPMGTLEERIKACLGAKRTQKYFVNENISAQLSLLEVLSGLNLTDAQKFDLIFIPFDSESYILRRDWISYVKDFIRGRSIPLPMKQHGQSLNALENYYKRLDLYYMFCTTMVVAFDKNKVYVEKEHTASEIHRILIRRPKSRKSPSFDKKAR